MNSLILGMSGFLGLESPAVGNKPEKGNNESASGVKITWCGHAMFLLEDSLGTKIVTDPYEEATGYTPPRISADIVTLSHHHYDHRNAAAISGSPRVIDQIGKFNVGNIAIEGIASYHDEAKGEKRGENIIFRFHLGGLTVVHMGDYGQPLTEEHAKAIAGSDILLIPIGGTFTIDHVQAVEIIKKTKPKIVIPMHFKTRDTTIKVAGPESFLKMMPRVKEVGTTIEVTNSLLPAETEVWLMDYIQ